MISRTWTAYALSGQSNARGTNAGNMIGTAMPHAIQMHDIDGGAWTAGIARYPTWWSTAAASAARQGPGAGMATAFRAAYPTRGFRLCKDAVGGSPIADWIATYAARHIATMSATGWGFGGGLVWVQGEEDAKDLTAATNYQASLATLFGLYRATFPTLKICVVKLSPNFTPLSGTAPYIAEIRAAQESYVAGDALATIVNVDEYGGLQYDGVHYDGAQQTVLGQRCFAALDAM